MSSQPRPQPQPGFVHLILFSLGVEHPFYLNIPIVVVNKLCLRPLQYLRYLGWCVLGVEADLVDEGGNAIALNGQWPGQRVFRYDVQNNNILAHAVDLEVIMQQSQIPSATTGTRGDFRDRVLKRDGCCVWTSRPGGTAMHIIPYARGDEACSDYSCPGIRAKFIIFLQWLQLIIANRPWPNDDNINISFGINDIENGIFADQNIHTEFFDQRKVVVLKTPNPILAATDVPDKHQRNTPTDVSYPSDSRYTFQWIVTEPDPFNVKFYPHNNDATFLDQQLDKPAELLLHYIYGAAAVRQWGKNSEVLANRPDIPRPSAPVPAPKERNTSKEAAAHFEAKNSWDEDDVMLHFWGNTKVAQDRHAQKEQERTASLENWRDAVTAESGL
ncbi:hypothetical protein FIBSPDRAFT_947518 [Athelia psychrophila]|uniref:HNH nuclease domain-containing protein n=1 Tax=Athelia psychrophila TaxID=1759441 RepID=A0A166RV79_9AGAM|nr:hypothetical protein FIBSPDRAFT_947518 [Fibularhizoctonia sp. CBS 109695]